MIRWKPHDLILQINNQKKVMKINTKQTVKDIQESFARKFSGLKLEFYSRPHEVGTLSPNEYKLNPETRLEELTSLDTSIEISINGHTKVGTLEKRFEELGLHVQVYWKSGDIWLQTATTDERTLSTLESYTKT